MKWRANNKLGITIDDFEVHWKLSTDALFLNSVLTTGNVASHRVDSGLETGLMYDFKVLAKNDDGQSAFSTVSSFMAARVPDAPLDITMMS